MSEQRAPVQGVGNYHLWVGHPAREPDARPAGTIAWGEHLQAWEAYAKRFGRDQSADRVAERGGFCYREVTEFLGHAPRTWRPR